MQPRYFFWLNHDLHKWKLGLSWLATSCSGITHVFFFSVPNALPRYFLLSQQMDVMSVTHPARYKLSWNPVVSLSSSIPPFPLSLLSNPNMPPQNNSTANPQPVGMSTTGTATTSRCICKPTQRQKDIGSNAILYTCIRETHINIRPGAAFSTCTTQKESAAKGPSQMSGSWREEWLQPGWSCIWR